MTIEDRIRQQFGALLFEILVTQQRAEDAEKMIAELKASQEAKTKAK